MRPLFPTFFAHQVPRPERRRLRLGARRHQPGNGENRIGHQQPPDADAGRAARLRQLHVSAGRFGVRLRAGARAER